MTNKHELQSRGQALESSLSELKRKRNRAEELGWEYSNKSRGKERHSSRGQQARERYDEITVEINKIAEQQSQLNKQLQMTDEWLDVAPSTPGGKGMMALDTQYDPWSKRTQYKESAISEAEPGPTTRTQINYKEPESPNRIPVASSQEESLLQTDIRKIPRSEVSSYKKRLEAYGNKLIRKIKENQIAPVPVSVISQVPKSKTPKYWQNSKVSDQSIVTPSFYNFVSPYSNLDVKISVPENDLNGIFIHEYRSHVPQKAAYYASELLKVNKKLKEVDALQEQYKQASASAEEEAAVRENRDTKTVDGYKKFVELFEMSGIHADDTVWERSVGEPILKELEPLLPKIIAHGRHNNRFLNEKVVKEIMQQ